MGTKQNEESDNVKNETNGKTKEKVFTLNLSGDWIYEDDAGTPPGEVVFRLSDNGQTVSARTLHEGVDTGAIYKVVVDRPARKIVIHEEDVGNLQDGGTIANR